MDTRIDWANQSPEYRKVMDRFNCHMLKFALAERLTLEQLVSLTNDMATGAVAASYDPVSYAKLAVLEMVLPEEELKEKVLMSDEKVEGIEPFVEVQTEKFRFLLEEAISRQFNVDVSKIRRRLDA